MHIINFLSTYAIDIVIVLVFLAVLGLLIRNRKFDLVRRIVFALVVEAEQQLGSKSGEAKKDYVVSKIYSRLPLIMRILITKDDLNAFIEEGVVWLKNSLETGKFDLIGYSDEQLKRILEESADTIETDES